MGKGDWLRPRKITPEQYTKNYEEAFGPPKPFPTVMSDEERQELQEEKERLSRELDK